MAQGSFFPGAGWDFLLLSANHQPSRDASPLTSLSARANPLLGQIQPSRGGDQSLLPWPRWAALLHAEGGKKPKKKQKQKKPLVTQHRAWLPEISLHSQVSCPNEDKLWVPPTAGGASGRGDADCEFFKHWENKP